MIINSAQRKYAKAIANGNPVEQGQENISKKALSIGLIAEMLARVSVESVAVQLQASQPESFSQLEKSLSKILGKQCLMASCFGKPTALNRLFMERYGKPYGNKYSFYREKLSDGVAVAANYSIITLRTLQRQVEQANAPVTVAGLYGSARIPMATAMLHIEVFDASLDGVTELVTSKNGETGFVLRDDIVHFTADNGLSFTKPVAQHMVGDTVSTEPQIGCPATLVKGFVQGIYSIAADNAVNMNLIQIA